MTIATSGISNKEFVHNVREVTTSNGLEKKIMTKIYHTIIVINHFVLIVQYQIVMNVMESNLINIKIIRDDCK